MKQINDIRSEYREYNYPRHQGDLTPRAEGYTDGLELIIRNNRDVDETLQYIRGLYEAAEWAFTDRELHDAE